MEGHLLLLLDSNKNANSVLLQTGKSLTQQMISQQPHSYLIYMKLIYA